MLQKVESWPVMINHHVLTEEQFNPFRTQHRQSTSEANKHHSAQSRCKIIEFNQRIKRIKSMQMIRNEEASVDVQRKQNLQTRASVVERVVHRSPGKVNLYQFKYNNPTLRHNPNHEGQHLRKGIKADSRAFRFYSPILQNQMIVDDSLFIKGQMKRIASAAQPPNEMAIFHKKMQKKIKETKQQ